MSSSSVLNIENDLVWNCSLVNVPSKPTRDWVNPLNKHIQIYVAKKHAHKYTIKMYYDYLVYLNIIIFIINVIIVLIIAESRRFFCFVVCVELVVKHAAFEILFWNECYSLAFYRISWIAFNCILRDTTLLLNLIAYELEFFVN